MGEDHDEGTRFVTKVSSIRGTPVLVTNTISDDVRVVGT